MMRSTWTFDDDPIGTLPADFTAILGTWQTAHDASAPSPPHVLTQTAPFRSGLHFPRCLLRGIRAADLVAEVAFKPLAGENDQAGGIMFRVQDPDTYYLFRANLLDDVALFKAASGTRRALARAQLRDEAWQRLRVEARGPGIRCYWNNRLVIQFEDRSFAEGAIGLWTISDSISAFDDLRIETL